MADESKGENHKIIKTSLFHFKYNVIWSGRVSSPPVIDQKPFQPFKPVS